MLPAEEQLLKNNNLRTLTVFSYFDYACLNPEKKNAFGQMEERSQRRREHVLPACPLLPCLGKRLL